jgi:hypothetical protein
MTDNLDYVNVLQFLAKIIEDYNKMIADAEIIGRTDSINLGEDLDNLKSMLEDPNISSYIDNIGLATKGSESFIDLFKKGAVAVDMHKIGKSNKDIAIELSSITGHNFTEKEVREWIKKYKSSSLTQKSNIYSISKVESGDIYEDILNRLSILITEIEREDDAVFAGARTTRHSALIEVLREIRMCQKDIMDWKSNTTDVMASVEPIIDAIIQTLRDKVPEHVFSDVLRSLKELHIFSDSLY